MTKPSFLWHDYETWGINPALNGPSQFAAIRTDWDLNPMGEEMMWYCKPPRDALPQPDACMVTGISPQTAEMHGVHEAEFMRLIHQQMMQSNTCSVGYNSMRFDDEVTRFALYRNFYDAYEREWKNGNSRWDLIDVVRLCAALRPDGVQWPLKDDGSPSYRLEALTAANHIEHQGAHDALVDVRATIALAKLLKTKQPKLFDYALSLRNKNTAMQRMDVGSQKPLFHISAMFGNANYCASLVLPLMPHPSNKNSVICYDLRYAPQAFLSLDLAQLKQRLFTPWNELEEGQQIAIKNIHLNKSPMIAPASMVDEKIAARIGMDLPTMRQHYDALVKGFNHHHQALLVEALTQDRERQEQDVDTALYGGGFFSDKDKTLMQQVRDSNAEQLAERSFDFDDNRLEEMLWRYRARNFPESLNETERQQWLAHCKQRIMQPSHPSLISAEAFQQRLEELFELHQDDEEKSLLLGELMDWHDALVFQL